MKKPNNKPAAPPELKYKVERLKRSHVLAAEGNRADGRGKDAKSLKELAASIREHGIVQPLTVRTHPAEKNKFELICGERRFLAAEIAGMDEVPCIVRECTDVEAIEIRAIENLQREGISSLEEASNYQALLDLNATTEVSQPLHTVETIARKVGKSPAYIYARLKLLSAPDVAKLALQSGKLADSVALLLSRILDPKAQHKATLEVLTSYGNNASEDHALDREMEPMSYRAAKSHIAMRYMVTLKQAPFNTEDAWLIPIELEGEARTLPDGSTGSRIAGGACSDCPYRTGNMKKFSFPDAESTDVCTQPGCFNRKKSAAQKAEKEKFAKKGQELLKDGTAKKILTYDGTAVRPESGFVDLNSPVPGKRNTTWGDVINEHLEDGVVPQVARGGKKNFVVLPVEIVNAAAEKAGVKAKVEVPEVQESHEEHEARREAKRLKAFSVAKAAMEQVNTALLDEKDSKPFLLFLAGHLVCPTYLDTHEVANTAAAIGKHLKGMSEGELRCVIVECQFLIGSGPVNWQGDFTEDFITLCEAHGADLKGLVKAENKKKPKETPELAMEGEVEGKK